MGKNSKDKNVTGIYEALLSFYRVKC